MITRWMRALAVALFLIPGLTFASPPAAFVPHSIKELDDSIGVTLTGAMVPTWDGTKFVPRLLTVSDVGGVAADSAVVHLAGAETIADLKTLSFANPRLKFTDTAGTGGTGQLSFTYGTNAGHTVMGFGPNLNLTQAAPGAINGSYDYSGWIQEAHYIDGSSKTNDEIYWNSTGNRVVFGSHNVTDSTAIFKVNGQFTVDGSLAGQRADSANRATVLISDSLSAGTVTLSISNQDATSHNSQFVIGAGSLGSATGWGFIEDYARTGSHKLMIQDRAGVEVFPLWIDSSDRVAIGHPYTDAVSAKLDVNGTMVATKAGIGTSSPSSVPVLAIGSNVNTVAATDLFIGGHTGNSSAVTRIRTGSYDDNADYGFYLKTDYSGGALAKFGTRDNTTDTDAFTIKGGTLKAAGYLSSDGTAGATATTGGLSFKNGLYTSGTATAPPTIATTTDLLKGDNAGNAVAFGSGTGVATFLATPSFANFNAATTGDDAAGLGAANVFTATNTFTSPKLVTSILDTNGANLLGLTATGSAVNYLTLANAATGNGPVISATGSDTNIHLFLNPKGTGKTYFGGSTTSGSIYTDGAGTVRLDSGSTNSSVYLSANTVDLVRVERSSLRSVIIDATTTLGFSNSGVASGSAIDTRMYRNGAGTFALRGQANSDWAKLQAGVISLQSLATPSAPTLATAGTAGSTTISYKITDELADGTATDASAVATITTANATLSSTNKVTVTLGTFPTGVTKRRVWRTATNGTSPTTTGSIGTITSGTTFDDTGQAGDSATAPTVNNTGVINANTISSVAGSAFVAQATIPAQAVGAIAGSAASFLASDAIAGSSTVGAGAGGSVVIQAGDAKRLTSGNANAGDVSIVAGSGIGTGRNGNILLKVGGTSGSVAWKVNESGHLLANADNTYDFGASGANRPRTGYFGTSVIAPTVNGTNYTGTTTNNNASAGSIGEYVESLIASGSAVSLTTATSANVTSISLTAGDWDVQGNVNFNETVSTVSARSAGINTTSATVPSDGSEAYCGVQSTLATETNSITLPRKRISVSSTTTVYLVGKATFSAGTCSEFGQINARRVR
jgi:hypothetical protein